jgi:hypothetical protein
MDESEYPWGDNYPPPPQQSIRIEGIKAWKDTMAASIDLLVAVEEADGMLLPEEVRVKAVALRAVFTELM